ncbi:MAG TPA: hypothetical protein VGQ62_02065, partial [Chloroflexota bacterium]|nr:hypothetical protein [Chloroflexota bacterium]
NCGFSEYIVADSTRRGTGLGRRLFERRKALLDEQARAYGYPACSGLFIEADNPDRTPADLVDAERETALDPRERLRLFDHLGFRKVDVPYVQPPLATGKQPIAYLDLLFAPWRQQHTDRIAAATVFATVEPVWSAWSADAAAHLAALRRLVTTAEVALEPLGDARQTVAQPLG